MDSFHTSNCGYTHWSLRGADNKLAISYTLAGGEEVVGDAVGEFGQDVGRGRSNDKRIGPLRLADVLNAIFSLAASQQPSTAPESSQRLVMTLWPVSAAKVRGWTNLAA
jgi:hypothetical protein